jgi:hypothetical protein
MEQRPFLEEELDRPCLFQGHLSYLTGLISLPLANYHGKLPCSLYGVIGMA